MRTEYDRVLVVGGGRAGVAAAEELRWQGYAGEITLLYDEDVPPYDRPACAKGVLTGHKRPSDIRLPMRVGGDVRWRLGRRAVHLDAAARTVGTDTGEAYEYDALVIATGARPVAPPGWPVGEPGLHLLYGISDAWGLRTALRDAERVAVVGAGLTGCETAHAMRTLARQCTLIDSKPYPMTRALGEHVGRYVARELARDGVHMRLGRRVTDLRRRGRRWRLALDDGEEVVADLVVATTGERPDTEWLARAPGLDVSDGVLCDEHLRVVGVPHAVAAGTVARWPNLRYSAEPVRIGQWISALEQGRAAARTLLADQEPVPMTHVPRFWSEQFGLRIQVCGILPPDAEVEVSQLRPGRNDVARSGVVATYRREGRPVGLVAVNAGRAFTTLARALLATADLAVAAPAPVATRRRRHLAAVG